MKHLLSIEAISRKEILTILENAKVFKRERGHHSRRPLTGQTWALLFAKFSTRTRVSESWSARSAAAVSAMSCLSKNRRAIPSSLRS